MHDFLPQVMKWKAIRIESQVTVNCSITSNLKYSWSVKSLNDSVAPSIDSTLLMHPFLLLPPHTLQLGHYLVTLKVRCHTWQIRNTINCFHITLFPCCVYLCKCIVYILCNALCFCVCIDHCLRNHFIIKFLKEFYLSLCLSIKTSILFYLFFKFLFTLGFHQWHRDSCVSWVSCQTSCKKEPAGKYNNWWCHSTCQS